MIAKHMKDRVKRRSWSELRDAGAIDELAAFVHGGGIVVYPTESSYALGVDPEIEEAVATLYRLKRRPSSKPLPVVGGSLERLEALGVRASAPGCLGLEKAWPGPLTMVLPCSRRLPAAAGRQELAVRIPGHRALCGLLSASGLALTATSANLAGDEPILDPELLDQLAENEELWLIDEGRLAGGPPSTLVRWDGDAITVLRAGALTLGDLQALAPGVEIRESFSAAAVEIPVEGVS